MSNTQSETQRGRFRFRVAEYADGTPWIMTDPLWPQDRLKALGQGFVGFDLKPGTSHEQAQQVTQFMNEHIEYITATLFKD
jgi:hypothetical protein